MQILATGTITVKKIPGGEYVYIYVGNVEALKKLRGKKICMIIFEECETPH
jgi:hypothetical protein